MAASKLSMTGKTVLITGASAGIGRCAALEFAKMNARVILACRNVQKAEKVAEEIKSKTANEKVEVEHLNLASFRSVHDCAERINKKEKNLHMLINNAGMIGVPYKATEDSQDIVMQVNYISHYWLTQLLLDKLKENTPSKIINVSSMIYRQADFNFENLNIRTRSPFHAYANSKLAIILYSRELAKRIEGTGVTVNAVHPGIVKTDLSKEGPLFNHLMAKLFMLVAGIPPEKGAETIVKLATDPALQNVNGKYFEKNRECALISKFEHEYKARRLVQTTERIIQEMKIF